MTDNVIPLRRAANRNAGTAPHQSEHADMIRRAMKRSSKLGRQMPMLAENLYRYLAAESERDGGFRQRFCEEAFKTDRHSSTKRLFGFALDPAKEGEAREKAINQLPKKADRYIVFASTLARLAGRHPDLVLVELFAGIDVSEAPYADVDPLTVDHRDELLRTLDRAAETIADKHKLTRAFELMRRVTFKKYEQSAARAVIADGLACGLASDENGVMAPSADDAYRTLGWSPAIFVGSFVLSSGRAVVREQRQFSPEAGVAIPHADAWWRWHVEVWWGIAPMGEHGTPASMMLVRGRTEVRHEIEIEAKDLQDQEHDEATDAELACRVLDASAEQYYLPKTKWYRGFCPAWTARERYGTRKLECVIEGIEEHLAAVNQLVPGAAEKGPYWDTRVLRPSNPEAIALLERRDSSDADWVGPTNHLYQIRRPLEPKEDDFATEEAFDAAHDAWREAISKAEQEEYERRYRFGRVGTMMTFAFEPGTIGGKLERSLLNVTGSDAPTSRLDRAAKLLADEAEQESSLLTAKWLKRMEDIRCSDGTLTSE